MKLIFEAKASGQLLLAYRDYQAEINGQDPSIFGGDFEERIFSAVEKEKIRVLNSGVRSVLGTIKEIEGYPEQDKLLEFISDRSGISRSDLLDKVTSRT